MHRGADDYLTKPLHFPELVVVVGRVLDHYALRRENERLRDALDNSEDADGPTWVGQSKASRELVGLIRQVASSNASVLVVGESGTGKELVARGLHHWGSRKSAPFIALRCAGMDEASLDAELFGGPAGEGALARAEGGTVFLDDVAELPAALQIKLLRFMQDGKLERSGAADVRIVAATDHDLLEHVTRGEFRDDLYYQLNVITLRVPTLRQRWEDLPALAMHFLQKHARQARKPIRGFNDRALGVLLHHDWPGNVRQLEHCVESAVVLCQGREIEPKHLPREIMSQAEPTGEMPRIPGATMAEIEKYAILTTLEHVRGSTSKAAEILGISPRKIQYRLAEYREADPSGVPAVVATKE